MAEGGEVATVSADNEVVYAPVTRDEIETFRKQAKDHLSFTLEGDGPVLVPVVGNDLLVTYNVVGERLTIVVKRTAKVFGMHLPVELVKDQLAKKIKEATGLVPVTS